MPDLDYVPRIEQISFHREGRYYTEMRYSIPKEYRADGIERSKAPRIAKYKFTTLDQCQDYARRWIDGMTVATGPAMLTIVQALDLWIAAKPSTRGEGKNPTFRRIIIAEYWKARPVSDFTPESVGAFIAALRLDDYAEGTIRNLVETTYAGVKHAYYYKRTQVPSDYVCPKLGDLDLPEASSRLHRYLIPDDEQKLWDFAEDLYRGNDKTRWAAALWVLIALETASRARAIELLKWVQVRRDDNIINFNPPDRAAPKRKKRAQVPISDRLRPIMQLAYTRRTDEYVLGEGGKPIGSRVALLFKQAGVMCTRHDLRRTWATLKAMAGCDLWFIAEILADNPLTVKKHYAQFVPKTRWAQTQMNVRIAPAANDDPIPEAPAERKLERA